MDKLKPSQSMNMARMSDGGYLSDSEDEGESTQTLGSSSTLGSLHKRTRSLNRDDFISDHIGAPTPTRPSNVLERTVQIPNTVVQSMAYIASLPFTAASPMSSTHPPARGGAAASKHPPAPRLSVMVPSTPSRGKKLDPAQVAREREELEQKVMGISKEVTMWQGKYKAVLRACEQMEQELLRRSSAAAAPAPIPSGHVLRMMEGSKRFGTEPSSGSQLTPQLQRTPSGVERARKGSLPSDSEEGGSGPSHPQPPPANRSPPSPPHGFVGGAVPTLQRQASLVSKPRPEAGVLGNMSAPSARSSGVNQAMSPPLTSLRDPGATSMPSISAPDAGCEPLRMFDHLVEYGVCGKTAMAMWSDAAAEGGGEGELESVHCIPELLYCYPNPSPVEELELFCFPDSDIVDCSGHLVKVRRISQDSPYTTSSHERKNGFAFVISADNFGADALYGVCCHWYEPVWPAEGDPQIESLRCVCILSRVAALQMHLRFSAELMLDRLLDVKKRHADGGKSQNARDVGVWEEYPSRRALELIEDYYAACPRGLERSEAADFTIRLGVVDHEDEGGSSRFDIVRCKWDMGPAGLPEIECVRFGMHVLFSRLSIPTVVTVLTAMLLERRIVVECDQPYTLSAIVMSLPWLLRPYKWQTHYIPYLPFPLLEFLSAPVPYIAGVLQPPAYGYEEGVLVLKPRTDTVENLEEEGAGWLPSAPILEELVDKLTLPHEHLSRRLDGEEARMWKRGMTKMSVESRTEIVGGMLAVISTAVSSILSLREIRGHCVGGKDLMSSDILTQDTKLSYLRTVKQEERAFMSELLETQLFASHFMKEVSTWFTYKVKGVDSLNAVAMETAINEKQKQIEELSLRLVQCNELLAANNAKSLEREQNLALMVDNRDEEVERLKMRIAELEAMSARIPIEGISEDSEGVGGRDGAGSVRGESAGEGDEGGGGALQDADVSVDEGGGERDVAVGEGLIPLMDDGASKDGGDDGEPIRGYDTNPKSGDSPRQSSSPITAEDDRDGVPPITADEEEAGEASLKTVLFSDDGIEAGFRSLVGTEDGDDSLR